MAMLWRRTHHMDPGAVALADRHYSRQHPGSPEFTAPGYKVVFVLPNYRAVWASHTPSAGIARADGLECWNCAVFRNESGRLASVLIRQAIAGTLWAWRYRPLPRDGFITYIDERKVALPPLGKPYGWTFLEAGFTATGYSKERHLLRVQLTQEQLRAIEPRPVLWLGGYEQAEMEWGA